MRCSKNYLRLKQKERIPNCAINIMRDRLISKLQDTLSVELNDLITNYNSV